MLQCEAQRGITRMSRARVRPVTCQAHPEVVTGRGRRKPWLRKDPTWPEAKVSPQEGVGLASVQLLLQLLQLGPRML